MTHTSPSPVGAAGEPWVASSGRGRAEGCLANQEAAAISGSFFTTLSRLSRLKRLQMNHHKAITLAGPPLLSAQPVALAEPPGPPSAGICCARGPPRAGGLRVSTAHRAQSP